MDFRPGWLRERKQHIRNVPRKTQWFESTTRLQTGGCKKSMLYVKTVVKPSTIPNIGLGLFADEDIAKGQLIWRFLTGFDLCFSEEDLLTLHPVLQKYVKKYAFLSIEGTSKGLWVFSSDNDKYQNSDMNRKNIGELKGSNPFTDDIVALRDIRRGEELFSYYQEWDGQEHDF